ncbi:MAG: histidine phosphatase family protein [Leptospiraceae bacterium]|nr:histidine phosphatase family protein [Leptospiraceae bacterium]MDW7975253.1 histidine phosphatase family protein [Leptospiraceae bacterium]
MLKIYLIRHGETNFNKEKRLQGGIETELNEKGIEQSNRLAKTLASEIPKVDFLFTSPQIRARQTAEILYQTFQEKQIPIEQFEMNELLREIRCGRWEGKLINEIEKEEPELFFLVKNSVNVPYPEGESIMDVKNRAEKFFSHLYSLNNHSNLTTIIVSHGTYIKTLSSVILSFPLEFSLKTILSNTGTSLIEEKDRPLNFKLIYWNSTKHL